MKKTILLCLAILSLAACGDDAATGDAGASAKAKNASNSSSTPANDAWFVHRITSLSEKSNFGRVDCFAEGEFENKGDQALYVAHVEYKTVLSDKAPEGSPDGQQMGIQLAPEFGKPNLNPLKPGEVRPVTLGPLYLSCDSFKELKLFAFYAQGINADGTANQGLVKAGVSALIIDNQTDLNFTR